VREGILPKTPKIGHQQQGNKNSEASNKNAPENTNSFFHIDDWLG
jgi:hypothetical protein